MGNFSLFDNAGAVIARRSTAKVDIFSITRKTPSANRTGTLALHNNATVFSVTHKGFTLSSAGATSLGLSMVMTGRNGNTGLMGRKGNILRLAGTDSCAGRALVGRKAVLLAKTNSLNSKTIALNNGKSTFLACTISTSRAITGIVNKANSVARGNPNGIALDNTGACTNAAGTRTKALTTKDTATFKADAISVSSKTALSVNGCTIGGTIGIGTNATSTLSANTVADGNNSVNDLALNDCSHLGIAKSVTVTTNSSFAFSVAKLATKKGTLIALANKLALAKARGIALGGCSALASSKSCSLLAIKDKALALNSFGVKSLVGSTRPRLACALKLSTSNGALRLGVRSSTGVLA